MRLLKSVRSLLQRLCSPVPLDTTKALARARARLPEALREPGQFLGLQYAGCGATIGAMPRCDFDCRGCYLGRESNTIPPRPVAEIQRQLDQIREWLGEGGNVQLTDGELTLRRESELIELIRYARAIGLVPMLMTHGDAFRRDGGLLERLMVEGGLSEVSIHVDTTQRGRRGDAYRHATREEELMPLRDEFARMIRRVRKKTRRRLEAAMTLTVTRENLSQVPAVIRWLLVNADAFKMISFQPIAQVGRTEDGLGGSVSVEALWRQIVRGLYGVAAPFERIVRDQGWLGHPECTRFVQGFAVTERHREPRFVPLYRRDDARDREFLRRWFQLLGGVSFRLDTRPEAAFRLAGVILRTPLFLLGEAPVFILRLLRRVADGAPGAFLSRWMRGRTRAHYLNIVSHHFMSPSELETPQGRERLELCIFKVPIEGRLTSMCEVNGAGIRKRYYEATRSVDATREHLS